MEERLLSPPKRTAYLWPHVLTWGQPTSFHRVCETHGICRMLPHARIFIATVTTRSVSDSTCGYRYFARIRGLELEPRSHGFPEGRIATSVYGVVWFGEMIARAVDRPYSGGLSRLNISPLKRAGDHRSTVTPP